MATRKRHIGSEQNQNYKEYKLIPNTKFHLSISGPKMWIDYNMRLLTKKKCGCYTTNTRNAYEHYTNWIKTYNMCLEHYNEHVMNHQPHYKIRKRDNPQQQEIGNTPQQQGIGNNPQQQGIGDSQMATTDQIRKEIRENRDSCTDVLFFLAKDTQQEMTDKIKDLTLPYVKDLEYFCTINNLIYNETYRNRRYNELHDLGRQNKCISSHGSATFASEHHTCTCEWVVSFNRIKYNKIAKKTYKFDIPDKDTKDNIGSITLYHCHLSSAIRLGININLG